MSSAPAWGLKGMAQNGPLPGIATTATRQSRVSPGGADGFHPRVHFRVTSRDPDGPSVMATGRAPTMHLSLSDQGRS